MIFLTILFWFSIFMVFYAYFGYPLFLVGLNIFKKAPKLIQSNNDTPFKVSLIITAYNEKLRIKEKIENSLIQDYPKAYFEIIVASDCSSDGTDEIVKEYESSGVKLVRAPERKGKENAQKYAVQAANGDIIVFSDVATILKPDGISNIVKNFDDDMVGCVSSEDKFIDQEGNVSGEGLYVRYEMFLRKLESRFNTLVGLSGSFFAARRKVCDNWAIDLQSDFNTLLNSIKLGLRGISDSNSIGYYKDIADESKEFKRKVRTVLRGISVMMRNLQVLNPKKYGIFAWQLFSHKLCRWMVPFFLILALVFNAAIMFSDMIYFGLFIFQLLFYCLAFIYYRQNIKNKPIIKLNLNPLSKIPYFFVSVNISILMAWIKYIKGERATFWEPSKR